MSLSVEEIVSQIDNDHFIYLLTNVLLGTNVLLDHHKFEKLLAQLMHITETRTAQFQNI